MGRLSSLARPALGGWFTFFSLAFVLMVSGLCPRSIATPADRKLTAGKLTHHVLVRLAYGPRPGQYQRVVRSDWKEWVENQLNPAGIDDDKLQQRLDRECPSLQLSLSELEQLHRENDPELERESRQRIKDELRWAVLLRAVYSERQFQEVIIDFWRNHFNVDVNKVPYLATHFEEHVLRELAFGKFETLLMATARHPAMLVYLDNYVSDRHGVNENYARELMELHTLGVDNGYQQEDVVSLAHVLTGWTCGWRPSTTGSEEYNFFFNTQAHDPTAASIVGLELDGQAGVTAGEDAIRHLARHENTSRFISSRLCRYLVNDAPDPELTERVAAVFRQTDGDLREVYRAIIFDPEFSAETNFRSKVRTPFEFVASTLRMTAAEIESPQRLFKELELMGQPIYECVEPTGYSDAQEAWLDPGVMIYRWNFAIKLVTGKLEGVSGGLDFIAPVLSAPVQTRSQKVMEILLPGITDTQLKQLLTFTHDPRALTAYVLGSPSFQQQ